MARKRKVPPDLPPLPQVNGSAAAVTVRTNICPRCMSRPKYQNEMVCFPCKKELDSKPRRRTYERAPAKTDRDYWQLARINLYPDRDFYSFTRQEFGRITRLARRMAKIPYEDGRVLPLDVEQEAVLHRFELGEIGFVQLREKIVIQASNEPLQVPEIDEVEALNAQVLAETDMQNEFDFNPSGVK